MVNDLGKYLRLHSHVSRRKVWGFRFIRERFQKTIASWKESFFYVGGKEVLIKAVIQVLPTFAMSCFKLP